MSISTKNNWGKELGDQQISISKTKKQFHFANKEAISKRNQFSKISGKW